MRNVAPDAGRAKEAMGDLKELKWGETPWDDLNRDELQCEVERMYAALLRLETVAKLCRGRDEQSPFWGTGGTGGGGLEMARQILQPLHAEYGAEGIYRAYFRYAVDLLFANSEYRIKSNWAVCDECGQMLGASSLDQDSLIGEPCASRLPKGCTGEFRKLEWKDLAK